MKPAGQVFVDLVSKQWWTDETIQSDAQGRGALRGYLGDYEVSLRYDGKKVSETVRLNRAGAEVILRLE